MVQISVRFDYYGNVSTRVTKSPDHIQDWNGSPYEGRFGMGDAVTDKLFPSG